MVLLLALTTDVVRQYQDLLFYSSGVSAISNGRKATIRDGGIIRSSLFKRESCSLKYSTGGIERIDNRIIRKPTRHECGVGIIMFF